jgi:hypothetical protein
MNVTEIRFNSPHAGYGTELMHNTNPQAAINLLKARVGPDVRVLTMKYYEVPSPTDRRDGGNRR